MSPYLDAVDVDAEAEHIVEDPEYDWTDDVDLHLDLVNALRKLDGYDLIIIHELFGCQTTVAELARMLGISRQAMQKQVERIEARIRDSMSS